MSPVGRHLFLKQISINKNWQIGNFRIKIIFAKKLVIRIADNKKPLLLLCETGLIQTFITCTAQKLNFPLRISSVNVTKSEGNCRSGPVYWRNP